jgi:hypothetical protein
VALDEKLRRRWSYLFFCLGCGFRVLVDLLSFRSFELVEVLLEDRDKTGSWWFLFMMLIPWVLLNAVVLFLGGDIDEGRCVDLLRDSLLKTASEWVCDQFVVTTLLRERETGV